LKQLLQRILKKIVKKKSLGTSDAWSLVHLSKRTRNPSYYSVDWRIFRSDAETQTQNAHYIWPNTVTSRNQISKEEMFWPTKVDTFFCSTKVHESRKYGIEIRHWFRFHIPKLGFDCTLVWGILCFMKMFFSLFSWLIFLILNGNNRLKWSQKSASLKTAL
jgi:hypothetical protein